jgi:hypothetical protein
MKLFLVLLLAASLRLWNLPNRMVFLADQGRDMLRVYELYQDRRLTLLGPPSSQGNFFFGPLYYYLIAPGLILFQFNPLGAILTVILIDLTGIYFLYRLTHSYAAVLIYATNPLLIYWSQSALNPFVIPGLGFICLYCLKRRRFFLTGLSAAAMFQLHYSTILFILLIFQFNFNFLLGLLLGISPMLAFELRHEFFNSQAIWAFVTTAGSRRFNPHYLVALIPFIACLIPWRRLPPLLIGLILLVQLARLDLNPPQGYTMPAGWNFPKSYAIAKLIAQDVGQLQPVNFNLTSMLDGDSRALPLRYLLISQFRTIPLGVESYPQAQVLYVLTRLPQVDILSHGLWEISSSGPKQITGSWTLADNIYLYRLQKL